MKPKVLVIDDEEHICEVIAEYLDGQGYEVFKAFNLMQARHHLKDGVVPDIVVLDVMLADGNGILFVRELRHNQIVKDVPVIMMSAHRTKSEDKVVGLEFGADDYITKPFDLRELNLRIEKLIKQKRLKMSRESVVPGVMRVEGDVTNALKDVLSTSPIENPPGPPPPRQPIEIKPTPSSSTSIGIRVLQLIAQPNLFFKELNNHPLPWLGPVLMTLAGGFYAIQQGISEHSYGVGFVGLIIYPLAFASAMGMISWMVQWWLGIKQNPMSFKRIFLHLGLASAPLVISGFLGVIYTISGGQAGDFTAGPLLFLTSQSSSKFMGFILRRLDFFEWWGVWLSAWVVSFLLGGERKRYFRRICGLWIIMVICLALLLGVFK